MAPVRLLTTLTVSNDLFCPKISLTLGQLVGILKVQYIDVIKDLTLHPSSSIISLRGRGGRQGP